jgi:hypothetical protein
LQGKALTSDILNAAFIVETGLPVYRAHKGHRLILGRLEAHMTGNSLPRFGMKQFFAIFVALATLSATMAVTTGDADARDRRAARNLALIGVGIVGGLALGALAAGAHDRPRYVEPGYAGDDVYFDQRSEKRGRYRRVYHTGSAFDHPVIVQRQRCRVRVIRTYDDEGNTYRQRVRVCR